MVFEGGKLKRLCGFGTCAGNIAPKNKRGGGGEPEVTTRSALSVSRARARYGWSRLYHPSPSSPRVLCFWLLSPRFPFCLSLFLPFLPFPLL